MMMLSYTGLLYIVILLPTNIASVSSSIQDCGITESSNHVLVDCSSIGLLQIPPKIPVTVTSLKLQNNSIDTIGASDLRDLLNLSQLDLSHNRISWIHDKALKVNLSLITHKTLIALNLRNNNISRIGSSFINREDGNFSSYHDLIELEHLDLGDNQLQTLPNEIFYALSLETVNLSGNPWRCDCHLKWLAKWLTVHRETTQPTEIEPTCGNSGPNIGKRIRRVEFNDFVCGPTPIPHSSTIFIREGALSEVLCPVSADPRPDIRWFVNGSLVTSNDVNEPMILQYVLVTQTLSIMLFPLNTQATYLLTCQANNTAGSLLISFLVQVVKSSDWKSKSHLSKLGTCFDDLTKLLAFSTVISGLVSVFTLSMIFHDKLKRYKRHRAQRNMYVMYRPPQTRGDHYTEPCYALLRQGQISTSATPHQRTTPEITRVENSQSSEVSDRSSQFSSYDSSGYLIVSDGENTGE
ncbi:hypothetical protein BSL78_00232 [Apostichopus japonicus]|uniref:Ig-like domain-containing protein n=1 Tax=Stichopus japonicus TaxID=307972 RepID=A0A2G8LRC8_STIJA|nr:hypothetical protein BSL78_00232 [Apostichopus japonicus]